jgi:bacillithiol biosynthesis cysteine-adding enzyme BshC
MAVARRMAGDRAGAEDQTAAAPAGSLGARIAAGDPAALRFFPGDPRSQADRVAIARAVLDRPRDREGLADVLDEQNATWAAPEPAAEAGVRAGIDALRRSDSVAVVTGQQLGLFGGPLYTVHKALSAVRYAARLSEESGRPAVPVFWLADEDHDFAEVRWASFAGGQQAVRVVYDDGAPADANRGAVGRIIVGESIERTLDDVGAALPAGPFSEHLLDAMRAAWRPGARWRDAFARTLRVLLPDAPLVFVSADDPRLKRIAAPLLAEEASGWMLTHEAHSTRSSEVEAAGFEVQVPPRPVHIFLMTEGARLALDPAGPEDAAGGVVARATGRAIPAAELAELAAGRPEDLSPDVVLRPLMQDYIFPTAAYVAGPGEAAYFAQLGTVYERFGVRMPIVAPRASMTLVEPAIRRALGALGLEVGDLADDPAALLTRIAVRSQAPGFESELSAAEAAAEAALSDAAAAASAVDPSLAAAGAAAMARTRRALDTLRTKAERVARRRAADDAARLERIRAALRPAGVPQERVHSALGLYARYGPALAGLIQASIDLDAAGHAVVDLP